MRTRNTMSKTEFVLYHFWWAAIAWIWYKNTLFRCLGGYSLKESRWILVVLIFACSAAGMAFEWKKQRNSISILMHLIASFGIYAVITYFPLRRTLVLVTMIPAVILTAAYFLYMVCYRIKDRRCLKKVLVRRMLRANEGCRNILCIGLALIMIITGIKAVFGSSLISPSVSPASRAKVEEHTIANHMNTLVQLEEETWRKLSIEDKLNVLQTVANIEQRYLGLPHELNVGASNLREELGGYYIDDRHEIIVSMDCLMMDTADELVNTIAHEAYHAAQYRMVDAYNEADEDAKSLVLYHDASIYKSEFEDYVDGFNDFYGYYSQKCESDARRYASEAVIEYFERVEEYLAGYPSYGTTVLVKKGD